MRTYKSFSSAETKKIGENFAKKILRNGPRRRGATAICLQGELGSGKTTFIQGFLRGLGIKRGGASPTFILMRRHGLSSFANASAVWRRKKFKNVYHVDAYRIRKPREFLKLGFKEILDDRENIVLVEWADRIKNVLPRCAFRLYFSHEKKESERKILAG